MKKKKIRIKLTKHANKKIVERKISIEIIHDVVNNPLLKEIDKFDSTLKHFINKIEKKYLRVIGRWENNETFLVISVFYDRRLLRRYKNDKI